MDFREIKKLTAYARRSGVKHLKLDGFEIEFQDGAPAPEPLRKPKLAPVQESSIPAPPPDPTLDQINQYIYGNNEEPA